MFIKILFNYRDELTQGECVIRANGPDTKDHGGHVDIKCKKKKRKKRHFEGKTTVAD